MIDSAIRASVPAELIARLVESGLWSPARALFYARQPADLASRARMLAVLMPAFREKERPAVIQEALTLASRVSSPYWRAWAYSVLADYLPKATAEEAATQGLAATAAVDADDDRAELLGWFAEQLPAPLLPDAMRLAREIADEGYRVQALLELVPLLPESALPEVLAALADVAGSSLRVQLITTVASRKPTALADALAAAARTLRAGDRALALSAVAKMTRVPDSHLVAEALAAARETTDPAERAVALGALSALFDVEQRKQMLDEALSDASSADEDDRLWAITWIAELLPAPRRRSVIGKLLRDALDRPAGSERTHQLAYLAEDLTEAQLAGVMPTVLATESEEDKAELLQAYAPFLTDRFLRLALQAAAALRDERSRGHVIQELAPELPEPLLAEAMSVVSGISDSDTRLSCVAALAGRLPDSLLGQALGMAQSSASESGTARFLLGLAQRWDEPHRTELLREALASAYAATDGLLRAQALGDLAATLAAGERDQVLAEAGGDRGICRGLWCRLRARLPDPPGRWRAPQEAHRGRLRQDTGHARYVVPASLARGSRTVCPQVGPRGPARRGTSRRPVTPVRARPAVSAQEHRDRLPRRRADRGVPRVSRARRGRRPPRRWRADDSNNR